MKLSKVALAIAGVLAVAAGSAQAGQINSSSSTLATEVIYSNAQVVRAPSNTYSFAGDIDARTNEQRLQLQYTLTKGTWAHAASGQVFPAVNTLVNGSALLGVNYLDQTNANKTALPAGSTVQAFLSADAKQLVFNITIPAATDLLKTPIFTINAGDTLGTNNVGLSGLLDVAGQTACVAPDSETFINFKHFTNHAGNTTILVNASPDSEHLRVGSTNEGRILSFTQNLRFDFTPSSKPGLTDASTINTTMRGNNWEGQNQIGTSTAIVPPAIGAAPASQYYLGYVKLSQRSNGLDTDYVHTYGDSASPFVATAPFIAADFVAAGTGTAANNVGEVEFASYTVTLALPAAWPTGTAVVVTNGATATPLTDVTATLDPATRKKITIAATSAAGAAALSNGAYVFAQFDGQNAIPQTGAITAEAAIVKAPAAATTFFAEQNNVCPGTFTGIGGGIKIDVRNYATHAKFGATGGPSSSIRVINNSESQSADVYGQIIYANGKYGPWGKLADVAPRAVVNLSSQQIEALLTNAPATTNPFGSGTVYTAEAGSAVIANDTAGTGDRLRIVSNTGSTLRVQSYMALGNMVMDTSGGQGVDFEAGTGGLANNNRVPDNALDSQPVSQDAINGLGR